MKQKGQKEGKTKAKMVESHNKGMLQIMSVLEDT